MTGEHRVQSEGPSGADASKVVAWVRGRWTPIDKIEAHRKGIRHKAVSVFVMRGTELLLQRRALDKYHSPGLWANACCTHPFLNETSAACARRRLKQELGIEGLTLTYRHSLEYRADVGGGMIEHELVDVFVADWTPDGRIDPNPDEVAEVAWVELNDVLADLEASPDKFAPWLGIYLGQHEKDILGDAPE